MAYIFTALFAAAIAVVGAWGPLLGAFTDREPLPFMRLESRTLPHVSVSDVAIAQIGDRYSRDYYGAYQFKVSNDSAYPITRITVECSVSWRNTGRTSQDRMSLLGEDVLMPGESQVFTAGKANDYAVSMDVPENLYCEVVRAGDPFSRWKGMPLEFSNLDWRQGYRERTRTR